MTSKPVILCLETSTTVCSVTVIRGINVLALKETDAGYQHAENLHLYIQEVLREAGVSPGDLSAVALSAGPGSYTGLRIGSSTAKGLCLALNIPLIALGTLTILAGVMAAAHPDAQAFCPMLDAGRMEVYTAVYDPQLAFLMPVQPLVLDDGSASHFVQWTPLVFGGPGSVKARALLGNLPATKWETWLLPSALHMTTQALAAFKGGNFTQIADFEPFYLKNYLAGKKKKDVL